jgi:hypothetical protein
MLKYIKTDVFLRLKRSCEVCILKLSIGFFLLKDISITNMASVSVDIHEDTTESIKIVTIATSDANTNDGVTCEVDEAASTPVNNSIFFAVETDTGSNGLVNWSYVFCF